MRTRVGSIVVVGLLGLAITAGAAELAWETASQVLQNNVGSWLPGSADSAVGGFIQLLRDNDGGGVGFDIGEAGTGDGIPDASTDEVLGTKWVGGGVFFPVANQDGTFVGDNVAGVNSGEVFYVRFFDTASPNFGSGLIPASGYYNTTEAFTRGGLPTPETFQLTQIIQATEAIPEPGTLSLIGLGLMTMIARRRRK